MFPGSRREKPRVGIWCFSSHYWEQTKLHREGEKKEGVEAVVLDCDHKCEWSGSAFTEIIGSGQGT